MNMNIVEKDIEHIEQEIIVEEAKTQAWQENKERFAPITLEELTGILDLTIKADNTNKIITFLCFLSAYTDSSQFNLSFNAPSSSGKSYIPTEIARIFPQEDVREIGYCSPTAFFHDKGQYNEENKSYEIDLERKILIFLDQLCWPRLSRPIFLCGGGLNFLWVCNFSDQWTQRACF